MWIDLKPLKRNRDFRYAYFGQFISFFGTMMSWVALPYQIYHLTNSTLAVGLLGIVELIPLLLTAFIGGTLADVLDRRKLLIRAEIGMAIGCLCLIVNATATDPKLWLIYLIAAILSALSGLHRPSLDALMPRLVSHEEIQDISVLVMFKSTVGMIGGPAIAGVCIASFGLAWTFALDFLTFIFSIAALMQIKSIAPPMDQEKPSLKSIIVAIQYAVSRQELMGTYVIDFFAMIFAMPNALFPALAVMLGGTKALGWLYAAPAIGALIITVFSAWTKKIKRHGAAVAIAAILWGSAIACVGLFNHLFMIVFFLILAGGADCISGIFRTTIWNETIPDKLRGRMASLEMVSYMSGPLLGNAQVGFLASMTSTQFAILLGGILCVIAVCVSIFLLPAFWKYRANPKKGGDLTMQRESHLFACHKFLEEAGSQILIRLAKIDFRDTHEIESLCNQLEDYVTTLANHARWEEEFIFNKFFTKEEVLSLFGEHSELERSGRKIIAEFKVLLNVPPQSRLYKGKLLYLDFRKFYAANLIHFYDEETTFLSLLQERATDDEIRAIDKPIYQDMSDSDIVEMLKQLLPPTNISEKKNILDDLKSFNSINFEFALPEIQKIL